MDYDVVILPSFAQVEGWRKRHADACGGGLFAQTVTTFDAWIADLWELHGDGRALVGDIARQLVMQAVFRACDSGFDSPGTALLAARCVRKTAGVPEFEEALDAACQGAPISGVSAREASFLAAMARYRDALGELGLVEPGWAAAALARDGAQVFSRVVHVLMPDAVPLTWIQQRFFAACPSLEVEIRPAQGAQGIPQAPERADVRFSFPSGRMAEAALVADIVSDRAAQGDVVIVCKDPLDLSARVQARLAGLGLHVRVQGGKPFAQTDFGRAFLALHRCLNGDPWDGVALADVLVSPFSGISPADAHKIDAAVRADRIAVRSDVLAALRAASEPFSQLEELATDPEADVLIGAFEQMAQAQSSRPPAWKSEQLAAMGTLREVTAAVRRIQGDIALCASVLERAMVPVSVQVAGPGPRVTFTTQSIAAHMDSGCCAGLVVADLTSEDYPVADKEDAAFTLMEKLGLAPEESALSRARRQFCALLQLPGASIDIVRPLGDDNAEPTYPCVVLEEFVDAYRPDSAATNDIDNAYRLPAQLQAGLVERGEELLFANAEGRAADAAQVVSAEVPQPQLQDLAGRVPVSDHAVSPSQIEVYLECPYRWFATRRMRIETLDEGFGPLERGTFAHAALQRFYQRFQDAGQLKVADRNLAEARLLMRQVLDELSAAQFDEEPRRSGRLVPATELERREVEALCQQLVAYLDFEAKLLPTFHPAHFEFSVSAEQAVQYAGHSLAGVVDRIDVDDRGNAVIIDYKGSVGPEYGIAGKDDRYAGKVQTRIYAQVVKRMLGLNVVGALYVSYGRKRAVAGAFDPRVLEAAHLPGMRHDDCACGTLGSVPDPAPEGFSYAELAFDAMLDATEARVGTAIESMAAGQVAPEPANPKACDFCPVLACPKRGA